MESGGFQDKAGVCVEVSDVFLEYQITGWMATFKGKFQGV